MGAGDIIFMVVVVGVAALTTILKNKVPAWLGFVLVLLGGLAAIVGGAVTKNFKVIPVGIAFVIGTIVVWVAGATSKPATNPEMPGDDDRPRKNLPDPDSLGAALGKSPWWALTILVVLVIAGFAVGFAIPTRA